MDSLSEFSEWLKKTYRFTIHPRAIELYKEENKEKQ